jgi:hypothetical protein
MVTSFILWLLQGWELRYFRINFSNKFGHPFRKPLHTALRSVEILGLHKLMGKLDAVCASANGMCQRCQIKGWVDVRGGVTRGTTITWASHGKAVRNPSGVISSIHKSVDGSLNPCKITLPLYSTSHLFWSKITLQPALQSRRIPMSKASAKLGTMCPVKMVGSPQMHMLHIHVGITCQPSGRFIIGGFFATLFFPHLPCP